MPRIWHVPVITLLLFIARWPSHAAERREWVTLTNCQYVAAKDNDGDSFRVRCGTNEYNVRLYFVDAPESNLRYPERTREQSEYFGVKLDDILKAGAQARDTVQEMLREPFVIQTRWATASGRGKETRYYALVEVGSKSLVEMLVSQGLVRIKGVWPNLPTGEKAKAYVERLEALEREARQTRRGLWASAAEKLSAIPGERAHLVFGGGGGPATVAWRQSSRQPAGSRAIQCRGARRWQLTERKAGPRGASPWVPRLTKACRRRRTASAPPSLPLPAAPDARRCYDFRCQGLSADFLRSS